MRAWFIVPLLLSTEAFGAIAYVQSKSCTAYSASVNCAFDTNMTAHSLILVQAATDNTPGLTCQDGRNGAYSKVLTTDAETGDTSASSNIFYWLDTSAGSTTITCARSGASVVEINIHEYSVATYPASFDTASSSSPVVAKTNPVSNSITTTVANEFVFSAATKMNGSPTAGSGTIRENSAYQYYYATQDQIVSTAGSHQSTFTQGSTDNWTMIQAAFKEYTAAGISANQQGSFFEVFP